MSANFWTSAHYQQWLFDKNDLLRLRQHDVTMLGEEDYQKILYLYSLFIQSLAKQMNMRQQVAATAQVYLRRFYCVHPLRSIDPLLLSVTALCLAAKVEEFGLYAANRMVAGAQNVVSQNFKHIWPNFPYTAQLLGTCEFYLLEAMDCCLIIYHPYRPLLTYAADMAVTGNQEFIDTAWRLASECIRSDIALLFPPFMIAIACLHAACALVCDNCRHRDWFAELAVDLDNILEITKMICHNFETLWRPFDDRSPEIIQLITTKQPKPRQQAQMPSQAPQVTAGHHSQVPNSSQHGSSQQQSQQHHHAQQQQQQRSMVHDLFT